MSILRRSEILAALIVASLTFAAPSRADDDALAPYRDRFRQGMEKYKAGAMAEAIRAWNAIYDEIGPQRGYRLSFNLARAYEANSETSRAAERYQTFLNEFGVRKAAGEALDPIVEREAQEAQSRLDQLDANNGRIQVVSGGSTLLVQIDASDPRLGTFVSYVAPGSHVVIFSPGSPGQERHDVSVKAGEIVVVSASPPLPPLVAPLPVVALPPKQHRMVLERPFSPVALYVTAGVAAASVVVPILTYANAGAIGTSYYASTTNPAARQQTYDNYVSARTVAYVTLAIPMALTALTGSLVVYYFGGSKERDVTIDAGVLPGGGGASIHASF